MDKDELISQLLKKGQDITQRVYLLAFFIVFILLILFVVRPTVGGYIDRRTELEKTKILSAQYQKVITSLNTLQRMLESRREDFALLEQAVPSSLAMYQLTQDVERTVLPHIPSQSYSFPGYSIPHRSDLAALTPVKTPQTYTIAVAVQGDYGTLKGVFAQLLNQRRIKNVRNLSMSREKGSSESAVLDMKLEIEAYHL